MKEEDGDNGRDSNTNDNQKGNSIRIGEDRTEPLRPNVSITGTGNEKKERRASAVPETRHCRLVIAWLYARNTWHRRIGVGSIRGRNLASRRHPRRQETLFELNGGETLSG